MTSSSSTSFASSSAVGSFSPPSSSPKPCSAPFMPNNSMFISASSAAKPSKPSSPSSPSAKSSPSTLSHSPASSDSRTLCTPTFSPNSFFPVFSKSTYSNPISVQMSSHSSLGMSRYGVVDCGMATARHTWSPLKPHARSIESAMACIVSFIAERSAWETGLRKQNIHAPSAVMTSRASGAVNAVRHSVKSVTSSTQIGRVVV
jgi:hypothetical protein